MRSICLINCTIGRAFTLAIYHLNGITGEYTPPEGYMAAINEPEEFAKFDALFPAKEKHSLPGQLFSE